MALHPNTHTHRHPPLYLSLRTSIPLYKAILPPSLSFADDNHQILSLRLAFRSKNNNSFPASTPKKLVESMLSSTSNPRTDNDGKPNVWNNDDFVIPIRSKDLNILTCNNPVAAAQIFHRLLEAVYSILIGLPQSSNSRITTPLADRACGIFGRPVAAFSVIEVQARLSLHAHMVLWGNINPRLLAMASTKENLRMAVCEVFDSQLSASMPLDQHLDGLYKRVQLSGYPHSKRYSYEECPLPSLDQKEWDQRVFSIHDATSIHQHSATCHKGKPDISCRLCYERALRLTTTVIELVQKETSSDQGTIQRLLSTPPHPTPSAQIMLLTTSNRHNLTVFIIIVSLLHIQILFSPTTAENPGRRVSEFEENPNGVSEPSIDCTRARDRVVFPLPHVDTRCLVWELARPYLELPTDTASWTSTGTLDNTKIMKLINELPDNVRSPLLKIASIRNVATVDISPAATALLACNTAALLLGCSEGCKATLFYLLKYITKDSTALGHSLTILKEALRKQELYTSTALDAGTDERSGKHLLAIMLNKLTGMTEMSDTQAASCNLGYSAHSSTESFTYVFVHDAVAALAARIIDQLVSHDDDENVDVEFSNEVVGNETVDQESDDDYDFDDLACFGDNVVDDAASARDTAPTVGTGTRYKITEPETGFERVEFITQEQHYRWRGESLRSVIYYQYPCMFEVVPRLNDDDATDNENGCIVPPGDNSEHDFKHDLTDEEGDENIHKQKSSKQVRRPHNSRFDFHKAHPLYETHQQRLRSKFLCPILAGGRPPAYPIAMKHTHHGENITALKEKYALYIMALFSPWSMDDDWAPIDGTSWSDYCFFIAKLDGVHLYTGIAVPTTFSNRCLMETIENISRAMAPPLPTVKKWTLAYRARCVIPWNSKDSHIIGPCDYDSTFKRSGAVFVDGTIGSNLNTVSGNREHDAAEDEIARIQALVKDVKSKSNENEIEKKNICNQQRQI